MHKKLLTAALFIREQKTANNFKNLLLAKWTCFIHMIKYDTVENQ